MFERFFDWVYGRMSEATVAIGVAFDALAKQAMEDELLKRKGEAFDARVVAQDNARRATINLPHGTLGFLSKTKPFLDEYNVEGMAWARCDMRRLTFVSVSCKTCQEKIVSTIDEFAFVALTGSRVVGLMAMLGEGFKRHSCNITLCESGSEVKIGLDE